jgi:5-methylcytosine-specific restriction endonuclease McrA
VALHVRDAFGAYRTTPEEEDSVSIPKKVRDALKERADIDGTPCCEICGKTANNAHHRKNQSQGGPDTLTNLMLLCGSGTTGCHGWVTVNPEKSRRNGWTLLRHQEPAHIPVRRRGVRVMLADDGFFIAIPELEAS